MFYTQLMINGKRQIQINGSLSFELISSKDQYFVGSNAAISLDSTWNIR